MGRIGCLVIGYICGNFLTAVLVCRLKGENIFEVGSGNPGMANVAANYGKCPGALVLAGDIGKTFLACLLCRYVLFPELGRLAVLYGGIGCIGGHNFPAWHHFQGGKGVACTCVTLFCLSPVWGIIACLCGLAVVLMKRGLALAAIVIPTAFLVPAFVTEGIEVGTGVAVMTALMYLRNMPPGRKEIDLKK